MKRKIIILILVLLIFSICKLNSTHNYYVKVSNVEKKKTFEGFIKQRPCTILSFQTNGKLVFLPLKKGDYVKKGEVLARLDNPTYEIGKVKFNLNDEINFNIILAPFDGYIEEIFVNRNSYVRAKKPVIAMYQTDKTEAEALISAQYINKINLNNKAKIKYKDLIYEAKISNVSKNDDNYLIELKLDNIYKDLKEGLNIEVELDLNK